MMSLCTMAPTLDILDSLLDHGRNWRFLFMQLIYYLWAEPVKFLFFKLSNMGNNRIYPQHCWFHLHRLTCNQYDTNHQGGLYLLFGPAALKLATTAGVHFSVLSYWMWISFSELNLKLYLHWWRHSSALSGVDRLWLSWSKANSHESWTHWNLRQIQRFWVGMDDWTWYFIPEHGEKKHTMLAKILSVGHVRFVSVTVYRCVWNHWSSLQKQNRNSRLIRDLVLVPSTRDSLDIRLVISVVFKGGKQKMEDQSAPQGRASTIGAPPGGWLL